MATESKANWTAQTESMMKMWNEAQRSMMQSWSELAGLGGNRAAMAPNMLDQWRWMAEQGTQAWTSGSGPMIRGVVDQMMSANDMLMRFMKLTTDAWQAVAPKIESGEDWQTAYRDYITKSYQQMLQSPANMMSMGKDMDEMWRFYIDEMQKISRPWVESFTETPWHLGQVMMGGAMGGGAELGEVNKMFWDAYERTLGRMTQLPGIGYTRELNAKLTRGFDAWVDFRRMSVEYHVSLSKIQMQAQERLLERLVEMSQKGQKVENVRDLINLWIEVTDRTFVETYRTEAYLEMQKKMAQAAMRYRMREQEVIEVMLKMYNLPTRSELDDAYRTLHDLRKEVRALKKELKAQSGGAAKPAAPPKKPASKPAAKAAEPTPAPASSKEEGA
jgi:class III poly(R)-hydroxyalkanoic acid synthase PhaE subunit